MSSIRAVAVVTGLLLATAAGAQTSAAPSSPGTANNPARPAGSNTAAPAANDASAMERAQRAAAGPMRMILEASRIKRRDGGEADGEAAPVRRPVRNDNGAAPAVAVPVTATSAAPVAAPTTPAATTAPVTPASPAVTAIVSLPELPAADAAAPLTTTPLGAIGRAAVPDLPTALPAPEQSIAAVPLPPTASTLAEDRPRLRTMIEPEVPQRVLDQIGRGEVLVEFTIRRDGTVVGVNLPPPAPRQLVRYVVEAVEQWRFEPQPADRQHRVVLVFNGSR